MKKQARADTRDGRLKEVKPMNTGAAPGADGILRAPNEELKTEEAQEVSEVNDNPAEPESEPSMDDIESMHDGDRAAEHELAVVQQDVATSATCDTGCRGLTDLTDAELDARIRKSMDKCERHHHAFLKEVKESLYPALLEMESRYEKQQGARSDLHEVLAQTWHKYLVSVGLKPGTFRMWKSRMVAALKQLEEVTGPEANQKSKTPSSRALKPTVRTFGQAQIALERRIFKDLKKADTPQDVDRLKELRERLSAPEAPYFGAEAAVRQLCEGLKGERWTAQVTQILDDVSGLMKRDADREAKKAPKKGPASVTVANLDEAAVPA